MGFLNTYRFSNGKAQYFFSLFSFIYSSIFIGRHESGFKKTILLYILLIKLYFVFLGVMCMFVSFLILKILFAIFWWRTDFFYKITVEKVIQRISE